MLKLYVLYLIACSSCVVSKLSLGAPSCVAPQSLQVNWLADFANKFNQINMCGYKTDSSAVIDKEGRWIVSYRANTAPISEAEAKKLCDCMYKFVFQSEWVGGAVHFCKAECTSLTLFVIASRNQDFLGLRPVTDTCHPVKVLGTALNKYSNAELGGKNCKSNAGVTSTGQFQIVSECDVDPDHEKVCRTIYDYLNPGNWLDNTTTNNCYVKNGKLYLNIIEKTVIGFCL